MDHNREALQSISKAADECFQKTMPKTGTSEEWKAAIDVWNKLLDDAIVSAEKMKVESVIGGNYFHAAIARDMAHYFKAMKATKDAPLPPVLPDAQEATTSEMIQSNLKGTLENPPDAKCSFCGKGRSETGLMVEGPAKDLFVCRHCSALVSTLFIVIDAKEAP